MTSIPRRLLVLLVSATLVASSGILAPPHADATSAHRSRPAQPSWRVAWAAGLHATVAGSTWEQHPTPPGPSMSDGTYRFVVKPTVAGDAVRVRLANWLDYGLGVTGALPVTFDSVTVAVRKGRSGATPKPGSMRTVTFHGASTTTILPNRDRLSDAVDLRVPKDASLLVSVHTSRADLTPASHAQTFVTQYATAEGAGDATRSPNGTLFVRKQEPIFWLDAVDVRTRAPHSIVAIGDSITDGEQCGRRRSDGSCRYDDDALMDRVSTYPVLLARRIRHTPGVPATGVVNKGVNGAVSLQTRLVLRDDVLRQSGVSAAIVEIGTNDLTVGVPEAVVRANLADIARALRRQGIRAIGATLVPRADMAGASETADRARARLNDWIRTSGTFDQVLDIAAAVGQGPDQNTFKPAFDSGDHLHPNTAGQRAIAAALDLGFLSQ